MRKTIIYTKAMESNTCKISLAAILILMSISTCVILMFAMYKFKCFLGIDLFPDKHFSDIIAISN